MEGFLILTGTVVAVTGLLAGGGYIFNLLLIPLKESQARLETELIEIKQNQTEIKQNQARFEREITLKLDQLLSQGKN